MHTHIYVMRTTKKATSTLTAMTYKQWTQQRQQQQQYAIGLSLSVRLNSSDQPSLKNKTAAQLFVLPQLHSSSNEPNDQNHIKQQQLQKLM